MVLETLGKVCIHLNIARFKVKLVEIVQVVLVIKEQALGTLLEGIQATVEPIVFPVVDLVYLRLHVAASHDQNYGFEVSQSAAHF